MCFYRDTQAAIARSNLQHLLKQRTSAVSKGSAKVVAENTEIKIKSEPYKKLHISKGLYDDLLKLSSGESELLEESHDHMDNQMEEETVDSRHSTEGSPLLPTNHTSSAVRPFHNEPVVAKDPLHLDLILNTLKTSLNEEKSMALETHNFFEGVLHLMEANNNLLKEFQNTHETMSSSLQGCLTFAKTSSAQKKEQTESPFERLEKMSQSEKHRQHYNSNPSSLELLSYFTHGRTQFPYELVLNGEITTPVFRERNIKIPVALIRKSDNAVIMNHGNMLLQMALYTWELPPNVITRNKTGNKVLQGEDECELKSGEAVFDKIQINEVTSKFINGYIAVVVVPKRPVNFGTSMESLYQKNSIRIEDIKPLLVSKLIVKSKKKKNAGKKNGGDAMQDIEDVNAI